MSENDPRWGDAQMAVLQASDRHDREIDELRKQVTQQATDIAVLKMQSAGYGVLGGILAAVGALLIGKL